MANGKADVALTLHAIEESKRLGDFIKAQNPATRGLFAPTARTEERNGMIIDYNVTIPTRDGVKLYGNIYRPADRKSEKLPVILNYCVYGKDGGIEISMFPPSSNLDAARISPEYLFEGTDAMWWCPHGYAVAVVDARGSFLSEGDKYYYGRIIGLDGYDIVEWLAAQEWSNGRVGMYGASAYAMVQWSTAAEQPPHLAAIMPYDGMTDLYREMAHKSGIPEEQFTNVYPTLFNWGNGLVEDSLAASADHPYFDEFWQSKVPALEKISCPAYIVCSWGDHGIHTRGTINGFYKISSPVKFLELHQYQKWDFALKPESLTRQKAFFDTFLRGEKTEVQYWPKVRYAVREAFYVGEWREAESFPIPNTQYTEYFPTPSKGLSLASQPAEHKSSYDSRSETLTFELPITKSFEFVGHSRLRLWVEAEGADNLDLFVTLRKVGKDGKPVYFPWLTIIDNGPIAFGFLRTSRRELDQSKSSPWQPYHTHARDLPPLKAGEVVPVDIEILPTSCRFRPGERLQVCIAGSDYGKYPTNIPVSRHPKNINKGRHVVHFGGKYNSGLLLPVLPPIENSWQEKNKTVKVFLSGTRPKSADVDVQAAVGIFGKKIEKIAETLPFLMATTTLITSPKGTLPALEANADSATATALGWSSFAGLQAIRHPAFATAVKPDLVPDNHKQIGSIAVAFSDVKFDPVGFVQRHDALVVLTYLPKAANFDPRQVAEDLGERAQSLAKAGAGTTLLRYVLNMDITPPNHAQMLGGTLFETVEWGAVAAVEQYWFADEAAAEAFFSDDGRAKVLKTLPTSMDGSKMFSIVGKESTQLEKDPDF